MGELMGASSANAEGGIGAGYKDDFSFDSSRFLKLGWMLPKKNVGVKGRPWGTYVLAV